MVKTHHTKIATYSTTVSAVLVVLVWWGFLFVGLFFVLFFSPFFPCALCLASYSVVSFFCLNICHPFPRAGVDCMCLSYPLHWWGKKEAGVRDGLCFSSLLSLANTFFAFPEKILYKWWLLEVRVFWERMCLEQVMLYARVVQEQLMPSLSFTEGSIIRHPLFFTASPPQDIFCPLCEIRLGILRQWELMTGEANAKTFTLRFLKAHGCLNKWNLRVS